MAQSVKRLTSAPGTISQSVGSSPLSDSVLTAGTLEPALDSAPPSLFAPLTPHPTPRHRTASLSNIKKLKKKKKEETQTHRPTERGAPCADKHPQGKVGMGRWSQRLECCVYSQGEPRAADGHQKFREGAGPCQHLDFRPLGSKSEREYISVVSSHPVCGPLLQEMNTVLHMGANTSVTSRPLTLLPGSGASHLPGHSSS